MEISELEKPLREHTDRDVLSFFSVGSRLAADSRKEKKKTNELHLKIWGRGRGSKNAAKH